MSALWSTTTIAALTAGFASGVLAAVLGVGGAVITTPFIRFLGATPIAAVGSTVPAILPGALTGTIRYHRAGLVRWDVARTCGLSGVVFAALGAWVADLVDARWLMIVTATLVLWSGSTLLRDARRAAVPRGLDRPSDGDRGTPPPRTDTAVLVALGTVAGFLAGLLGIGGGLVLTPGMNLIVRLPVKQAIATSLAAVAMMSVTALAAHVAFGHVDWRFALPLAVGIVPGAHVGSRFTIGASDRTMRLLCGGLLVGLAFIYLGRELAGIV